MKIIGITGGIGDGKTQVLEYLHNRYGATVCRRMMWQRNFRKRAGRVMTPL